MILVLVLPSQVTVSASSLDSKKCPMCELKGEPANMTAKGSQHSRKADTITPTIAVILDI